MGMSCALLAIHAKKSHLQKQKTKAIRIPEPGARYFCKETHDITENVARMASGYRLAWQQ
jgi:hypothetical protein